MMTTHTEIVHQENRPEHVIKMNTVTDIAAEIQPRNYLHATKSVDAVDPETNMLDAKADQRNEKDVIQGIVVEVDQKSVGQEIADVRLVHRKNDHHCPRLEGKVGHRLQNGIDHHLQDHSDVAARHPTD